MKKRGFTLIEVMGVIILLSLIVLLAFPAIVSVIKRSGSKINAATEALILSGAKNMVDEHKNDYPLNNGNVYCTTIGKLINGNYVISDLQNGNNGENIDTTKSITITVKNSKYEFAITDTCTEKK